MFRPPLLRFLQCLMMLCLAAFSACESTNNVPSGTKWVVSVPKAPFYKFGPAQTFGADFALNEGAEVIMLEHSSGYSRVMTADGTSGFVSTEDLKPKVTSYTTSRNVSTNYTTQLNRPLFDTSTSVEKHSNVPSTKGSPLFDQGDGPLPQNSSTPKPAPGFRY
jgi:hypothetical protein